MSAPVAGTWTPFWTSLREGRFTVQQCTACGRWTWVPKWWCPACHQDALAWREPSGRGRVYSYSIVRRPQRADLATPYVVAIVELDEGPRVLTRLVEAEPEAVHIGLAVEGAWERGSEGYPFRPVGGAA